MVVDKAENLEKFMEGVVARNDRGFVMTGPDVFVEGKRPSTWNLDRDPMPMETSVPGIFAAGDVRHGVVRRVASAVGQGSVAISMIHRRSRRRRVAGR